MPWLELLAHLASVLTALVAAAAAVYYWNDKKAKQRRLEVYCTTHLQPPTNTRSSISWQGLASQKKRFFTRAFPAATLFAESERITVAAWPNS